MSRSPLASRLAGLGMVGGLLLGPALADEPPRASTILADLPADVVARLGQDSTATPRQQLQAVFEASRPYVFDAGPLVVRTDSRWFSTIPQGGSGAPLIELRRWPGDTVLSLYCVAPTPPEKAPPLGDSPFARVKDHGPWARWTGAVDPGAGSRPALWLERRVGDAPAVLGALLLPGDAGMGPGAVEDLTHELLSVLDRVEPREAVWRVREALPRGSRIRLPAASRGPGDQDEASAPWQVARGSGFTLGMPPGFRARTMDGGAPPPRPLEGGLLWLRGRFVDGAGTEVIVGDGDRAGSVVHVAELSEGWGAGRVPPVAVPGATRLASEPFPLAADRTGAQTARAERWREEGFDGEWLVFRLGFEAYGVEIALPMIAGRRSPSVFWIPATWRPGDRAPAPPPVDPADRFGIRFERLTRGGQGRQPWTEGYLTVPGLRVELPKGWWPAAALRSADGFPIRLVDEAGRTVGELVRLAAGEAAAELEASDDWSEQQRPGARRAQSVYRKADQTHLLVAREGHAFLFRPKPVQGESSEFWGRMLGTVTLLRSEPSAGPDPNR